MECESAFAKKAACRQRCLCSADDRDPWSRGQLCPLAMNILKIVIMEQKYPVPHEVTSLSSYRVQVSVRKRERSHHPGYSDRTLLECIGVETQAGPFVWSV